MASTHQHNNTSTLQHCGNIYNPPHYLHVVKVVVSLGLIRQSGVDVDGIRTVHDEFVVVTHMSLW
jgi:hypothetical protein